jgi:hypothetical protein
LKVATSDTALLKTLQATTKGGVGSLTKQTAALISSGTREALPILSLLKKLSKSPGNPTVEGKLSTQATGLVANITTRVDAIFSSADTFATTAFGELNALAAANSSDAKTQTDVSTLETDFSNGATNAENSLNTLLAGANTFLTDASA